MQPETRPIRLLIPQSRTYYLFGFVVRFLDDCLTQPFVVLNTANIWRLFELTKFVYHFF